MAELMKLLQPESALQSDFMEALLSQGFKDHAKIGGGLQTTSTTTTTNANLNVTKINSNTTSTITSSTTGNINDNVSNVNIDNANNRNGASNTPAQISASNKTNINETSNLNQQGSQQFFYVDPKANSLADTQAVLSQIKESPSEKRRVLIDQVTDVSTEAHMSTTLNTQSNIREANEKISRQQQGATPQHMPEMPKDPSVMIKYFLNSMVAEMTKVVNFSKTLPGFTELDMSDQLSLIKQGLFEVMIARITLLIDHVNDTMIDPSLNMKSPRAMVRQMPPLGPFIDQFFDVAKQTNPLNLTDGENGLFGAILILCPDRHSLKNSSAVQALQQLYLQALHILMKHNHKDADEKFCSLLSSIPSIRKINDEHFRFLSNIKQKSGPEFEALFPQLHRELFDTSLH